MAVNSTIILIMFTTVIAVFATVCFLGAVIVDGRKKGIRGGTGDDAWVFSNFTARTFYAIFPNKTPEMVATDMGIKVEEYYKNCAVVKEEPDLMQLVMHFIYGYAILILSVPIGLMTTFLITVLGMAVFLYLAYLPQSRLKRKANARRMVVADELPGFLGLLQTELAVGLPIEAAMQLLANKQDGLLAEELRGVFRKTELGSSGWTKELEDFAVVYDVDTLKDFAMNVSSSYTRGVSITETIERTAQDIREAHLLSVESSAGKMTNYILLPIAVFQFVPVIIFMLIPVVSALRMVWG